MPSPSVDVVRAFVRPRCARQVRVPAVVAVAAALTTAFVEPSGLAAAPASSSTAEPASQEQGLLVVAAEGAEDDAFGLARALYGTPGLRPAVAEDDGRALLGDVGADPGQGTADGGAGLRELAELRRGARGDDAATRLVLGTLARRFRAAAVVLVTTSPRLARVYRPGDGAFDGARYEPDANAASPWAATVRSLERAYGAPPANVRATPRPPTEGRGGDRPFYASAWFWSAVGAAALGGAALYLATRDNDPETIHLQVRVRP